MRACTAAVFGLVALALVARPVAAQDDRSVEVTPYVALGSQGASPVGTAVTFPITSRLGLETDVAYRGGLKTPINDKLGLRTDARWYKSFGRQGSEQFHVAQGLSFDVGRR